MFLFILEWSLQVSKDDNKTAIEVYFMKNWFYKQTPFRPYPK